MTRDGLGPARAIRSGDQVMLASLIEEYVIWHVDWLASDGRTAFADAGASLCLLG